MCAGPDGLRRGRPGPRRGVRLGRNGDPASDDVAERAVVVPVSLVVARGLSSPLMEMNSLKILIQIYTESLCFHALNHAVKLLQLDPADN